MASYFQVIAKARLAGAVEMRNIFTLSCPTLPTRAEILTDVPAWLTGFYTPILGSLCNVYVVYGWTANLWNATTSTWDPYVQGNISLTGTNNNDPFPSQMAAVLIAYTGLKRTFSRKFIGGLNELTATGNAITSTLITALTSTIVFWFSDFTAPSAKIYTAGLWSKTNTFVDFTQGIVDGIMGTMRRRKLNVGL